MVGLAGGKSDRTDIKAKIMIGFGHVKFEVQVEYPRLEIDICKGRINKGQSACGGRWGI